MNAKRFMILSLSAVTLAQATLAHASAPLIGLKSHRELFESMCAVTGISPATQSVNAVYLESRGSLSESGRYEDMNSIMAMTAAKLASSVCSAFVTTEAAKEGKDRLVYKLIDFTKGPSSIGGDAREEMISAMADAFWQRKASDAEAAAVTTFFDEGSKGLADNAQSTRALMVSTCVQGLASLEFLKN